MKKGQKVRLQSGFFVPLNIAQALNELSTQTVVYNTQRQYGLNEQHNDCFWFHPEFAYDKCIYDDTRCIGTKKCKYYETEFQHQVREAIDRAENEK